MTSPQRPAASTLARTGHRRLALATLGVVLFIAGPSVRGDNGAALETLTSVDALYNVPAAQADRPHHFRWDLDVLYSDPAWNLLWVESNGIPTFIPTTNEFPRLKAGSKVRLEGDLIPAQGLPLARANVSELSATTGIAPLPTTGNLADSNRFTNRLVSLTAVVDRQSNPDPGHLMLEASAEGIHIVIRAQCKADEPRPSFEGAIVEATGVYVGQRNFSGELSSIALWAPNPASIRILGTLQDDPAFTAPVTRIEEFDTPTGGRPVHIVGMIHALDNTAATITLRDATGQVIVSTAQTFGLRPGQLLEAVGMPESAGLQRRLRDARVRPLALSAPKAADPILPGTLRLADQVLGLKPDAADRGLPVQLFGVATWLAPDRATLFLQDLTGGIEIRLPANTPPPPILPCAVRIDGHSERGAFAPRVTATQLVWNNPLGSPAPRMASLDEMLSGTLHGRWVGTQALVRAVRLEADATRIELTTITGEFEALLPPGIDPSAPPGSVVSMQGVCSVIANERHQLTGVRLLVPAATYIAVEQKAPAAPFALPTTTLAGLREFVATDSALRRVCTSGTVVYCEPGRLAWLQDGNDSLLVLSRDPMSLLPGDRVEAAGLPGREGSRVVLREASIRRTGKAEEPTPIELLHPTIVDGPLDGHLVRIIGTVAGLQRRPTETIITVEAEKRLFHASLARGTIDEEACPEGGRVALLGVYRAIYDEDRQPIDFTLRLRSPSDIAVLTAPPLWTVSRALTAASGLCLLTAAVLGWLAVLRARVTKQTAQIRAQLAHQSRLEADLQKAQRIESLGLLAGGIAHDFNNLLTGILGNLGLAKLDETALATVGDCLTEAEYAALRARDLTQRLMVFTKGSPSVRTVVRLPPLVHESVTFVLHGASARCEFDFADDLWLANVDRVQIGQVVQNLAINAAQAMPTGGTLRFALANDVVTAGFRADLAPGRYIRLSATDTGIGIPAELLPKIFDPYFTTKKTGNGLGLATVYSIVRRHGGHIEVESTPGQGTAFRVWLPAAAADQLPEETSSDFVPTFSDLAAPLAARVLVMDDDLVIRRTVAIALFRAGYEVTTTADGREAAEEFITAAKRGRSYQLVLLDLTVPGEIGGREALVAIRNLDPKVRAIVSTGYSNDPVFIAYRDHGFDAALPKPYEVRELLAVVGKTIAHQPK